MADEGLPAGETFLLILEFAVPLLDLGLAALERFLAIGEAAFDVADLLAGRLGFLLELLATGDHLVARPDGSLLEDAVGLLAALFQDLVALGPGFRLFASDDALINKPTDQKARDQAPDAAEQIIHVPAPFPEAGNPRGAPLSRALIQIVPTASAVGPETPRIRLDEPAGFAGLAF